MLQEFYGFAPQDICIMIDTDPAYTKPTGKNMKVCGWLLLLFVLLLVAAVVVWWFVCDIHVHARPRWSGCG